MIGRLLPRRLATRITLVAVVAVGIALAVVGLGVLVGVGRADRRALDRELTREADRIEHVADRRGGPPGLFDGDESGRGAGVVTPGSGDGPPAPGPPGIAGAAPRFGGGPPLDVLDPGADRFARVLRGGVPLTSTGAAVPVGFPLPTGSGLATVETSGKRWRVVSRGLPQGAQLQVAARLAPLDERTNRLRLVVLLALGAGLLGTAAVAGSLVRVALRPLQRLRETAGDVAATADLSRRVPVGSGPEEVDALATDLNEMLARLEVASAARESALQSARRFAADAGHELRTPLTSLRANLDAAGHQARGADADVDAALAACAGDAARMQALVEQLQALARGEAGPPASAEPVDLGELADAAVLALRTRHPQVTAELQAPERGPLVSGDPESLRMLLDNLLENAAVHGREGGSILTTITAAGELLVDDDGPGVPAPERRSVLERFARGSSARGPGTGLGLAIAAAQAARHGGSLELGEAPAGGLRARVTLPVAPAG